MADYQEGRIKFTFDESLPLIRAEDCSFYRKTFQTFCGGCKEMDFIFYDPEDKCLWFLEVKDYRTKRRAKSIELVDEIAQKTRDSLAFLFAGRTNSNEAPGAKEVKWFMQKAGDYTKIRIALHLEDSPT